MARTPGARKRHSFFKSPRSYITTNDNRKDRRLVVNNAVIMIIAPSIDRPGKPRLLLGLMKMEPTRTSFWKTPRLPRQVHEPQCPEQDYISDCREYDRLETRRHAKTGNSYASIMAKCSINVLLCREKGAGALYSEDCTKYYIRTFKWPIKIQQVVVAPSLTSPAKRRKPQLDFIRSTQIKMKG